MEVDSLSQQICRKLIAIITFAQTESKRVATTELKLNRKWKTYENLLSEMEYPFSLSVTSSIILIPVFVKPKVVSH